MTRVRNFVADLLRGSTSAKEAKKLADNCYGDKSLKTRAIYKILSRLRKAKRPKTEGSPIQKNCLHHRSHRRCHRRCWGWLLNMHQDPCLSPWHVCWFHFRHPSEELRLVKKRARWVPNLLSQEQMDRRMETSAAFVKMIQDKGQKPPREDYHHRWVGGLHAHVYH